MNNLNGRYYKVTKVTIANSTKCLVCDVELLVGKRCIFIPRYINRMTRVGSRIHLTCFSKFVNSIRDIKDEQLDRLKKLEIVDKL